MSQYVVLSKWDVRKLRNFLTQDSPEVEMLALRCRGKYWELDAHAVHLYGCRIFCRLWSSLKKVVVYYSDTLVSALKTSMYEHSSSPCVTSQSNTVHDLPFSRIWILLQTFLILLRRRIGPPRDLYRQTTTQLQIKIKHTFMLQVGFEPTIPCLKVDAVDHMITDTDIVACPHRKSTL
jgi:hypothetical protein